MRIFLKSGATVERFSGCILDRVPVRAIAEAVRTGEIPRTLQNLDCPR